MKAIILAGGFGSRLKEVTGGDIPKPMVMIAGKPFLEHQIVFLKEQGIKEIILAVHHMSDKIKSYFGTGLRWGLDITYSEEESPLGTGGAIKKAEKYINDTFIVLNGDSYSQINLKEFLDFHRSRKSDFTISLRKMNGISHYGSVTMNGDKIVKFNEKKEDGGEGLINSGVYIFEPKIFKYMEADKNISLEKEIFVKIASENSLYGYQYNGYFIDLGRPETYKQFKEDIIKTFLFMSNDNKVREAMQKISRSGINLILVVDPNKRLLGVVNDRIIREYLIKGGNIEDSLNRAMIRDPITANINDDPIKISEMLRSGIHHLPIIDDNRVVRDIEFHSEKIKTETFPVLRGKAPLRISFAGGGTDLPSFYKKYGGIVINAAIDKYCYATIMKRADSKIHINSDLGDEVIFDLKEKLNYDGKFDLIKSIINLMNLDFGIDLYLHNDIPPGRGLGSSATLAVLIISLISHLQNKQYDDYKIAEIAFKAERDELKISGGWQDQYAAVTGGFNFIEFSQDKTILYPLRLKEEVINELNHHLLLCYVGVSHFSGHQQKELEDNFIKSEEEIVKIQNENKNIAIEIKDALLKYELENLGLLLNKTWENKKKTSRIVSNSNIDNLYQIGLKNGAFGGRLLGSGGGGYILFFYSPIKRNQLTKSLKDAGGEVVDFHFEFSGVKIWPVKTKT